MYIIRAKVYDSSERSFAYLHLVAVAVHKHFLAW